MNEKDFAELSAGHALHALSPDDERAYRAALAEHPEWTAVADLDDEVAATLADGFGEELAPVSVRAALLAQIAQLPQADASAPRTHPGVALSLPIDVPRDGSETDAAPTESFDPEATHVVDVVAPAPAEDATPVETEAAEQPEPELPPVPDVPASDAAEAEPVPSTAPPTEAVQTIQRKNWTRGLFALVASAALLVGIGWGVGAITEQVRTPVEIQALEQIESAADAQSVVGQFADGGEATVHWSATVGKAVLTSADLPSIDADRSFELWYVRDGGPVSAGVFEPGDDEVTALLDGDMEVGDVIAVTVEAQGGSTIGAPTTDPIIAIETDPTVES